jgi:hypothetical protein
LCTILFFSIVTAVNWHVTTSKSVSKKLTLLQFVGA